MCIILGKGVCEVMQSNIAKKIKMIFLAFQKIQKLPKLIIKYGSHVFFALFALGTFLVAHNVIAQKFDPYIEFLGLSIVRTSFIILAEVIIGGLLIDYAIKK